MLLASLSVLSSRLSDPQLTLISSLLLYDVSMVLSFLELPSVTLLFGASISYAFYITSCILLHVDINDILYSLNVSGLFSTFFVVHLYIYPNLFRTYVSCHSQYKTL